MPNDAIRTSDDDELNKEATLMRDREFNAKKLLCTKYGFSESHLNLLREFFMDKDEVAFQWGDPISTTWTIQYEFWNNKVIKYHKLANERGRVWNWIRGFHAKCSDSTEPRYLKVLPNETITFSIDYWMQEYENSWIIQLQISIDIFRPVCNIDQICNSIGKGTKEFTLKVPEKPGLYMLWARNDLQYSLEDAENNWPKTYDNSSNWYDEGFIAWIRVDSNTEVKPYGEKSKLITDDDNIDDDDDDIDDNGNGGGNGSDNGVMKRRSGNGGDDIDGSDNGNGGNGSNNGGYEEEEW